MFAARKSPRRRSRRFSGNRSGSAAVEFVLVAPFFFLLTFGLAEVSMIGFAQTTLDHGVSEISRTIRTGQAQNTNTSAVQMKANLCAEIRSILTLDCGQHLYLDVQSYPSYVIPNASPISGGNVNTGPMGYNPGVASDIVVVRAYYRWEVLTPGFKTLFANLSSGERLLGSSIMFRNEPFGGGGP